MIHHGYKCIFVHIPRTGGSSVEGVLWGRKRRGLWWGYDDKLSGFLQHLTCRQILDQDYVDGSTFRQCFKFTFVRNPWDRCLSEYIWRIKRAGNFVDARINIEKYGPNQVTTEYVRNNVTLKEFLNRDFPWHEVSYHQHEASQCAYVMDSKGKPLIDFIGRFERLQQDFDTICDILAIPRTELPHRNNTDHASYWDYYDDETREIVAKKYRNDIETFDYRFGE